MTNTLRVREHKAFLRVIFKYLLCFYFLFISFDTMIKKNNTLRVRRKKSIILNKCVSAIFFIALYVFVVFNLWISYTKPLKYCYAAHYVHKYCPQWFTLAFHVVPRAVMEKCNEKKKPQSNSLTALNSGKF